MKTKTCDVAIIGAGSAGLSARSAAIANGAKVLLIEHGMGGTTCARVGCMPSKLLLAAAHAAYAARNAYRFGINLRDGIEVDGIAVMRRVREQRDRFVASVLKSTEPLGEDEMLRGAARFAGSGQLVVGDHVRVEARSIVIATGSSSRILKPLESLKSRVLTNETIFELEELPRSLAVLGAGPLGLELAQGMARLGVEVVVFDKVKTIGGLRDPAVTSVALDIFGEVLDLRLETEILDAREHAAGVDLKWRDVAGAEHSQTFEYILAAAGRAPNLQKLGLENAGLALDEEGVPAFNRETMQCGESAVFIAGDVDADRPVLHEAAAEGRIAGVNAARYPEIEKTERMTPLAITFSDPNIAAIGATYAQATAADAIVGEASYDDQGRAKVFLQNAGLIRIYADKAGLLLGAEMIGPAVEHSAHLLAWCIQQKLKASDVLQFPFYHPTFEEGLRTALREVCKKAGSMQKADRDGVTLGPAS